MSTPDLAEATAILAAQPFNDLVGARLAAFGDGRAEIRIPLRPDLLQHFGFAHGGLVAAVGAVLQGAAWQRCRVHFMRNVLTKVPKADADMVATWIRTIFTMGTPGAVRAQLDHVADTLRELTSACLEGHEIGTHFNGHFCGPDGVASWTPEQWTSELEQAKWMVEH